MSLVGYAYNLGTEERLDKRNKVRLHCTASLRLACLHLKHAYILKLIRLAKVQYPHASVYFLTIATQISERKLK